MADAAVWFPNYFLTDKDSISILKRFEIALQTIPERNIEKCFYNCLNLSSVSLRP